MSKKANPARDRLMLAAMDARDLLRTIAPEHCVDMPPGMLGY
jgi:hypothetical protein